jgi:hypothetical protein
MNMLRGIAAAVIALDHFGRNDLEQLRTILDGAAELLFEHPGSGSIAGFDRGFGVKWIHKKVASSLKAAG